ncbi:hypothetical protein [Mucilaginibacter segetis]|uniref:Uncharacterized protein n=1 Tax=Mucilaginibacter segetis TaxID=2793071 RepID=A0A934ULI3_9SPHI|nr:hypothetical protein [Mucilaginibacter segetis]MBK0377995.1 hypothetical protein [Mucilaginibacter segetis]
MKVENPAAFDFIMHEELYLLHHDKTKHGTTQADALPVETLEPDFNYMGNRSSSYLILVNYKDSEFLPLEHNTALESMLNRKDMQLKDVAIVNMFNCQLTNMQMLTAFFNPQKLIIFGNDALPQDMEAPELNNPQKTEKHAVLFTLSFEQMMQSNEYKKAFWEQMKIF